MIRTELVALFDDYLINARDHLESDNFLSGLDVTDTAAEDLFKDVVLWAEQTGVLKTPV